MLAGMSEAPASELANIWASADRTAYFEQRLFIRSPLNDFWTAFVIFLLLCGTFVAIAGIEAMPLFTRVANGIVVAEPVRTAFALAVTLGASLYIQRYTRVREREDYAGFARTLSSAAIERHNLLGFTPRDSRLVPATWVGLIAGVLVAWPLYGHYLSDTPKLPSTFAWFAVVTTILAMER